MSGIGRFDVRSLAVYAAAENPRGNPSLNFCNFRTFKL